MPVRFTILPALAVALDATSASAQPSQTPPVETCEEGTNVGCEEEDLRLHPNVGPWNFLVAAGIGFPEGVHTEAGVRAGNAYFYGGLGWFLPKELEGPSVYRVGIDRIFGKFGRGFVGGGYVWTPRHYMHRGEFSAIAVRIGVNAEVSRHASIRLSTGLGGVLFEDDGGLALPWLELNLALAYRL